MRRPYRRLMGHLAFLAMALLCLMPTLSRLTAAESAGHGAAASVTVAATASTHCPAAPFAATPSVAHLRRTTTIRCTDRPARPWLRFLRRRRMEAISVQSRQARPRRRTRQARTDHGGTDCDYCPLLASLLTQAVFEQAPRLLHAEARTHAIQRSEFLPAPMVPSLGSRGPPTAA